MAAFGMLGDAVLVNDVPRWCVCDPGGANYLLEPIEIETGGVTLSGRCCTQCFSLARLSAAETHSLLARRNQALEELKDTPEGAVLSQHLAPLSASRKVIRVVLYRVYDFFKF